MSQDVPENGKDVAHHIQDFIFVRELSEVYLLLDHISGRWDKTLYAESKSKTPDYPSEPDWIDQICEIGWPPTGSEVEHAQQAARLLRAKDRLNEAAKPASGATIAFTLMVIGEDLAGPWWRRWRAKYGRRDGDSAESAGNGSPREPAAGGLAQARFGKTPSRISLARTAFPGLVGNAYWFKLWIRAIVSILFLWLIFTCALSWNVAAGRAILARLDALQAESSEIRKTIIRAETSVLNADGNVSRNAIAAAGKSRDLVVRFCEAPLTLPLKEVRKGKEPIEQFHSVDEIHICEALKENRREHAISSRNLGDWLFLWRPLNVGQSHRAASAGAAGVQVDDGDAVTLTDDAGDAEWGRVLTVVLANAVLPLCYGLLGAGAAVVRDLWAKMRESLLSPRDLTLALGQLALGAIIGACIGLFVNPSGVPAHGESGLMSAVALSGSALSFIAGFGVEGVFVALESLVKRVFNMPDPSRKA